MLSTHAFNALLKLIEEPPDHVVFVLATTDTHKVPATIISRTQRFDFRRLTTDAIAGKLTRIVSAEGAEAEAEALALIARLADGSMRDAESLLDQVLAFAGDRVTVEAVREAVGLAEDETVADLLQAYLGGDAPAALDRIQSLADRGRDMAQVAAQAEAEARRLLLASAADPPLARRLAHILRTLAEAAGAGAREGRARLAMELLAVEPSPGVAVAAPALAVQPPAPAPAPERAAPTRVAAAPAQAAPVEPAPAPPEKPTVEAAPSATADGSGARPEVAALRARWADVIEHAPPAIKPLLRECRPIAVNGARLTLAFPEERGFMREKATTRAGAIELLLGSVLGGSWAIDCVATNVELEPLTVEQAVAPDPTDPEARSLLEGVLRITGGELIDAPEVH
jgi:DNA polymerase-3 subunit gamma/tau